MRTVLCLTFAALGSGLSGPAIAEEPAGKAAGIKALMETSAGMTSLPFRDVVRASCGHEVIPVDPDAAEDQALLDHLTQAADALLAWMNAKDHPLGGLRRINEASRPVEDELHRLLNQGDFTCAIPVTAAGKSQRAGYPDLMLTHKPSGRITYLDPKLFEDTSRQSTLRTFYYEPSALNGKVQQDARHLLLGITHDGNDGAWTFPGWELIDLHDLQVRLKVEFQGSNRDLYQEGMLLRRSASTVTKD